MKVSKEANAAVAKAASVFVLYATSCANNVALKSNRKTLQGSDVIQAMKVGNGYPHLPLLMQGGMVGYLIAIFFFATYGYFWALLAIKIHLTAHFF